MAEVPNLYAVADFRALVNNGDFVSEILFFSPMQRKI